ncbi:MAG: SurA N-terminal domain-containing protein [Desulfuromonadaceae bacterium]|nr:SurA N-terminal domain-containing protein [Desulfuromonas sp.]MDY0185442.1 SurA N-terminal domain-containing protein [Desulfuromonadaceae bacterium]
MLDLIRKKQKTFIVKVVFWTIITAFIGTIFLVWGKGQEQNEQLTVAVKVGNIDISFDEFRIAHNNLYNLYKNLYGDTFTPENEKQLQLTRQAVDMLVDQALLLKKAAEMGIKVSKDELVSAIASVEVFQVDGTFDKKRYVEVLSYQRMTPQDFEQMQRHQMLVNRVRAQIQGQVQVTDADVVAEFRRIMEKINLAYVEFDPKNYLDAVVLDAAAVERYYGENKEQYRIPEQVALEYVEISAESVREQIDPTPEELERYYQRHLDEFSIEEQLQARHIQFKVAPDADAQTRQDKRAQALKVLAELNADNFATLAKRYSEDVESAAAGGDLGYFKRDTFGAAFENAAFALAIGEISGVVESNVGYHIIQATEHIQAGYKPLEQVRGQVVEGFIADQSIKLAYEKAIDAYNMNRKQGGIVTVAQQLGLSPLKTGLFARNETIGGIGTVPELGNQAFGVSEGNMLKPLKIRNKVVLAQVTERKPSYIPELEQVRADVENKVRLQQAVAMAEQQAGAAVQTLLQGGEIAAVAPSAAAVKETGLFARTLGGVVPGIGPHEELTQAAFSLSIEHPVAEQAYRQGNNFYVIKLKQLQAANPAELSQEESDAIEAEVRRSKQDAALQAVLDEKRQSVAVIIAPSILNTLKEE